MLMFLGFWGGGLMLMFLGGDGEAFLGGGGEGEPHPPGPPLGRFWRGGGEGERPRPGDSRPFLGGGDKDCFLDGALALGDSDRLGLRFQLGPLRGGRGEPEGERVFGLPRGGGEGEREMALSPLDPSPLKGAPKPPIRGDGLRPIRPLARGGGEAEGDRRFGTLRGFGEGDLLKGRRCGGGGLLETERLGGRLRGGGEGECPFLATGVFFGGDLDLRPPPLGGGDADGDRRMIIPPLRGGGEGERERDLFAIGFLGGGDGDLPGGARPAFLGGGEGDRSHWPSPGDGERRPRGGGARRGGGLGDRPLGGERAAPRRRGGGEADGDRPRPFLSLKPPRGDRSYLLPLL